MIEVNYLLEGKNECLVLIDIVVLKVHTNKNMLIEQLPPILIIHLKCFFYDDADGTKKLNKSISYSVNLTLPKSK